MRVLIGALLLTLCAMQTHRRAEAWRSDQALWGSATVTSPSLVRPWLNLAEAQTRTGHWTAAMEALRQAQIRIQQPHRYPLPWPGDTSARAMVLWIDGVTQLCDTPTWASTCAFWVRS